MTGGRHDRKIWTAETLRDPHAQADKADKVRRTFDAIADRYDLANTLISFGLAFSWRKRLVRMIREQKIQPGRILDLCCGTGAMMNLLSSAFPTADLIGTDFSFNMLTQARKKRLGRDGHYVSGDGMALPFGDEGFDAVSCVFGLRNYESLETGLNEIHRVLRKNGLLAILDFQMPHSRCFGPLFRFYFQRILPILASAVADKQKIGAYEYLPESVHRWYDIKRILEFMSNCGLRPVQVRSMCFGSVWAVVAVK
jgi:demethylmenaquinone methyltransferase/2-methoxy-6-polyprenyl-1,4-benzoquinol methylase